MAIEAPVAPPEVAPAKTRPARKADVPAVPPAFLEEGQPPTPVKAPNIAQQRRLQRKAGRPPGRIPLAGSNRASVGVAIMARNASKTLPALMASIRPFVQQIVIGVDELTTDDTAKVAKKCGADEVFSLHVSDWHECGRHERVLAQHFAHARQETFRHLNPDLDFWMWIDADDVLVGGEKLKAALEGLPPEFVGIWLKYEYGALTRADGQRRVNTLFHRERLLRTKYQDQQVEWLWESRVHETVKPTNTPPNAGWVLNNDIVVVHQDHAHVTNDSAPRNLLLLELELEERPDDPRTITYLGYTNFALGNWAQAVSWFEMRARLGGENLYEIWSAYLYLSIAYENMNDLDSANRAAYAALDVVPAHGEPYFRIAAIAKLAGEFEKAVHWNNMARAGLREGWLQSAPFFAFKNPLDYTFNQRVVQGEALMNLGRVDEAEKEFRAAADVFVDERLGAALNDVHQIQANIKAAEDFVGIAPLLNGQAKDVYEHLPLPVKALGRTRDMVFPSILESRALSTQPRIVFWCGKGAEPWGPPSLNATGIGGSETAVIEIAKRFAADGWRVDVFNEAERYEGTYEGVGYWDLRRWDGSAADVLVCWRQPHLPAEMKIGKQNILWCHDLHYGPDPDGDFQKWDAVLGVSQWHGRMLRHYYPGGTADDGSYGYGYVPNGLDLSRFAERPEKVPFRCVYASSPDRGLVTLLNLWPEILKAEPEAELHVGYGWETIDKMILGGRDDLAQFKAMVVKQIEAMPRVVWRGRLPQDELAKLYGESVAWLYPTDFLEVSCISAMEAMAGGAIPIATACGALPETVGNAGFLVPGPPTARGFQDTFPKAALAVLGDTKVRLNYSEQARAWASGWTWDQSYEVWKEHVTIHNMELVTA